MTQEELTETLLKVRKLEISVVDGVKLINQHVKEEKEKIANQLRSLPFHPEVIGHEGGNSIAQVTYTHHIVDIENELRK